MAQICIVMGSRSDEEIAGKATQVLEEMGIEYELHVASAHRNPLEVERIIGESKASVFIGIAGLAAHLPGFMASRTSKPVIGVPVSGKLGGLDALLSMVQMPKGVPVATVGIDRGDNAAILAARILALVNPDVESKMERGS